MHTDRTNIRASKLILATNAYTGALYFVSCLVHHSHPSTGRLPSARLAHCEQPSSYASDDLRKPYILRTYAVSSRASLEQEISSLVSVLVPPHDRLLTLFKAVGQDLELMASSHHWMIQQLIQKSQNT